MALSTLKVKRVGPGRYGDGNGLYLLVKPSGSRSWVLRVQFRGRRRDIGLGSIAALGLADAREKAANLRQHALNGRDPALERDRQFVTIPTFRSATRATHDALKANWIDKNAAAFLTSLDMYAFPTIGDLPVNEVSASHIRDLLEPIWTAKPDLARKVRMRVGQVLNFSFSKGWRPTEAPSRSVTLGLPKQPKGGNFRAMPYQEIPPFARYLRAGRTTGRKALLFLILTGARSREVRMARWNQIDLQEGLWRRPASIMKMREPHIVTLSPAAVGLLKNFRKATMAGSDDLVFPGRKDAELSDMTLAKVIRDSGQPFDVHGFRSSFRDWAAEQASDIPDPVAEAALAHAVPDKVVRAYKRTNFLEMRRTLMARWSDFVGGW